MIKRITVLFLFTFFLFCDDPEQSKNNAYLDFLSAYYYKASVCQSEPGYFLYIPENASRRWLNACLLSIIRSECPFFEYPIVCFKIYDTSE